MLEPDVADKVATLDAKTNNKEIHIAASNKTEFLSLYFDDKAWCLLVPPGGLIRGVFTFYLDV